VTTGLSDSLSGVEFFMLDRLAEWGLSIDQVVLTQTTGLETLLAGAADISTGAADESLMGLAQGADPVIIGSMESKVNYVLVAKKEHTTIEDLRGGVVGISGPGGFNTLLSNMAVRSVGLEPGIDVELQQIGGSPERAAALLAGQVDAASVFLSDALELEAASDNLHVLARYADIIPEPGSSTWFSVGGYWAANPDISLAWACANLQANRWANENRSDYIEMILDRVEGTTRGPTEKMYDQAVLVDMWPRNWRDVVKTEYLENLNGMLVSTGDLEAEVDVTGVVDSSYLEAAHAAGC
jgi:NitT/TauT family transport system substrate-binding protein